MKQRGTALTAMGLSALMVIFAVVAMAVFAALSVSTAMAQRRLGEKTREPIAQYYEADSQAHEILARLRTGEMPPGVTQDGDIYTYCCNLGENRHLAVQVQLTEEDYRVLSWQVCTDTWQTEEQLPVWKGE